jgi:nitrogen fixation protein NifU and related proteins
MYNPTIIEHFKNPRNAGEIEAPALTVEVSNPACGDVLRLSVLFEGDRVAKVRYKVRGCTAAIAAGSVLTELLRGKQAAELGSTDAGSVEAALGGLAPESQHAAVLCADAVKAVVRARAG